MKPKLKMAVPVLALKISLLLTEYFYAAFENEYFLTILCEKQYASRVVGYVWTVGEMYPNDELLLVTIPWGKGMRNMVSVVALAC